ncbi:MAG: nuclear transport factor 2 family protein [Deltaproteobacteria bacterium]|nr:nuclear transport factor 2 family protein [Deltaproteobacteria bacterium]MBW2143539.1 nuclear transport factor 2 family protein [Deltaproteobacteria bacterium]
MSKNIEIIHRFFDALERLDLDAVSEFFTEDGIYHDIPVPTDPTVGREGIRKKLELVANATDRLEMQLSSVIGEGDTVMTERVEIWHFPTGERPRLPVMSIFEMKDGRIAAWREYWDLNMLMSQLPPDYLEALSNIEM